MLQLKRDEKIRKSHMRRTLNTFLLVYEICDELLLVISTSIYSIASETFLNKWFSPTKDNRPDFLNMALGCSFNLTKYTSIDLLL